MSGNQNPYDPAKIFQEWMRKGGEAQAEFARNFAALTSQKPEFDPLKHLQEIMQKASETHSAMTEGAERLQSNGFKEFLKASQSFPNFFNWGAYKTNVGTNGRISIPEAEREALGLVEGDLVQVVIIPVTKKGSRREVNI